MFLDVEHDQIDFQGDLFIPSFQHGEERLTIPLIHERHSRERMMTATKIVMTDESAVLETFDFRSEFYFNDFLIRLGERLHVSVPPPPAADENGPVTFSWNGSAFNAGWTETHGCFVRVAAHDRTLLERMQAVLES